MSDEPIDYHSQDTLHSVYNELKAVEIQIEAVGRNIKKLAKKETDTNADYELLKNNYLIVLYIDENKNVTKKRTELQRAVLYRTKHHAERLARDLAKADIKSERDLLSALQSKLQGIQSRKSILVVEKDFEGNK